MSEHPFRSTLVATLATAALALGGLGCTQNEEAEPVTAAPEAAPQPAEAEAEVEAENVRVIQIAAKDHAYEPSSFRATPGERVMLRVVNEGRSQHSIDFHLDGDEVALAEPLQPGQSATLTLTAPQSPGTYVYYCPLHDHREKGMEGQLVVESAPSGE